MRKIILSTATLLAALSLTTLPASAGVVTYTTSSDFAAAVTVGGTDTFTAGTYSGVGTNTITSSALMFTGLVNPAINVNFGPTGWSGNFLTSATMLTIAPIAADIGLIYGISFDLGCYSCNAGVTDTVVVNYAGGPSTFSLLNAGSTGFWGVSSTNAITSIVITTPVGGYVSLDNAQFGTLTAGTGGGGGGGGDGTTPEPMTLVLIGSGLGVIARCRRYAPKRSVTSAS